MTTKEYSDFFYLANLHMQDPNCRKGQAYMVALFHTHRDLYDEITDTDADPFYDDSKIPAFDRKFAELAGINTRL